MQVKILHTGGSRNEWLLIFEIWYVICRPPRRRYSVKDLGASTFYLGDKECRRHDIEVKHIFMFFFRDTCLRVEKHLCLHLQ